MTAYNTTFNVLSTIPANNLGWIATAVAGAVIIGLLFLTIYNIRKFLYGSAVTAILGVIYLISRYIGVNTAEANYTPLVWLIGTLVFIIASISIGAILEHRGILNKIEEKLISFSDDEDEVDEIEECMKKLVEEEKEDGKE